MDGLTPDELRRPIWLLGDSLPKNYVGKLNGALDPRHPTRHSIWTPIWNEIQETVYLPDRRRVDGKRLCVANAVKTEPGCDPNWQFECQELKDRVAVYAREVAEFRPRIILTFGRRAFCFALYARGETPRYKAGSWSCEQLGKEFRNRLAQFKSDGINILPLLHATISRGQFIKAHEGFTGVPGGNYFEFAGQQLGNVMKDHVASLDIWVPG